MSYLLGIIGKLVALYRREPAATQSAVALIWGAAIAIDRGLIEHVQVLNWQVVVAGLVALYGILVRAQVIPTAKVKAQFLAASKEQPVVIPPPAPPKEG